MSSDITKANIERNVARLEHDAKALREHLGQLEKEIEQIRKEQLEEKSKCEYNFKLKKVDGVVDSAMSAGFEFYQKLLKNFDIKANRYDGDFEPDCLFEPRLCGEYENLGLYLGTDEFLEWVIVEDSDGASVLTTRHNQQIVENLIQRVKISDGLD